MAPVELALVSRGGGEPSTASNSAGNVARNALGGALAVETEAGSSCEAGSGCAAALTGSGCAAALTAAPVPSDDHFGPPVSPPRSDEAAARTAVNDGVGPWAAESEVARQNAGLAGGVNITNGPTAAPGGGTGPLLGVHMPGRTASDAGS